MTYVMSDIHGCYDKYMNMLSKINFSCDDTLYILGDVVDRGNGGMKVILDAAARENVITLKGNHDHEAYVFLKNLTMPIDDPRACEFASVFRVWLSDSGIPTYESFIKLCDSEKETVLLYLNSLPIFEEIVICGRKYFLAHTVPEREKMLDFDRCRISDFIIGEPEYDKTYFEDTVIVTGHTPTELIDKSRAGKIWSKNNHIAVDCGAVFGNPLGCICLESGEEFYAD